METRSPNSLFGDVRNGNYTRIDPMLGLMSFKGQARPFIGVMIPLSAMQQTSSKPDYDATNLGYLFPNNDTAEILSVNIPLDHDYAAGTSLYPRLVWHQASANVPVWKIAYRWVDPGEQVGPFTTATSTGREYTYVQGTIQQVSYFPTIPGADRKMGSVLQVKLYRDDAVLAGDALAVAFGVYKRIDSLGSQTLTLKSIPGALVSSSVSSSPSASLSGSATTSPSSTASASISGSPTTSASSSLSDSPSASLSGSATTSASSSVSSSPSASISGSPTTSASSSVSSSPSASLSGSATTSASSSASSSPTTSASSSPTTSASSSVSASASGSVTTSASASPSSSPS